MQVPLLNVSNILCTYFIDFGRCLRQSHNGENSFVYKMQTSAPMSHISDSLILASVFLTFFKCSAYYSYTS